jgi:DNA-binding MarR family transcriptional regulator
MWRTFIETVEALTNELSSRLRSETGLSSGDYLVLLTLSEADGKVLRSSELAAHIGWDRSRLSHHLGRMEGRRLIRREPSESDLRGAEVVLTTSGAEAFRRSTVPHLRAVRELFVDALTPQQLAAATEIAEALREHLEPRHTEPSR